MQFQINPAPAGEGLSNLSVMPILPAHDCCRSGIFRSGDAINLLSRSKSKLIPGGREWLQFQIDLAPAGEGLSNLSVMPILPACDCCKSGIFRSGDAINLLSRSKSKLIPGGRECVQFQIDLAPAGERFSISQHKTMPNLPAHDCCKSGIIRSGDAVSVLRKQIQIVWCSVH